MIAIALETDAESRLTGHRGLSIRLTEERLEHILEHPEMEGMKSTIEETLLQPSAVVQSLSDPEARLYYRFYTGSKVGDKYFCVVVKVEKDDAFILTAYFTDKRKKGLVLWPEKK